jgi:NADP-dependent 3-hydroxy acid dehydrogenase YdfG
MSNAVPTGSLSGRVAVVTGASSGIGAATAELLAAQGAAVALLARRKERLDEIVGRITAAGGTALALPVDVTDAHALTEAAARVEAELGQASIVVNNAGVMLPAPIDEYAVDQWQHQIDLNITAAMSTIAAFTPQLIASAEADGVADLVNTSSVAAQNIYVNFAVYAASKAFITHLTKNLRAELGPKKVRVAAIEPGIVGTELQSHVTDEGALAWLEDSKDTVEWLTGEDVAQTVAFLVGLPARVNLWQVGILPTGQAM